MELPLGFFKFPIFQELKFILAGFGVICGEHIKSMPIGKTSQTQEHFSTSNQLVFPGVKNKENVVEVNSQSQEEEGQSSIDDQLKKLSMEDNVEVKGPPKLSREEKYILQIEADACSIFVGNIASDVTPEIIEEHFAECGEIKRITLLHDKHTGVPKGYAYVQFESADVQEKALRLNGTVLKGNKINVYKKRTNFPGYHKYSQYRRPLYYPDHWGYTYGGLPHFNSINFFPPYPFQQDQYKQIGRFNPSYRSKQRNNYKEGRKDNGLRHFRRYNDCPFQNVQKRPSNHEQILQDGNQFPSRSPLTEK